MSWQDVLFVLMFKTSDRCLLPTDPFQQTITSSKLPTETQKQDVKTI